MPTRLSRIFMQAHSFLILIGLIFASCLDLTVEQVGHERGLEYLDRAKEGQYEFQPCLAICLVNRAEGDHHWRFPLQAVRLSLTLGL